MKTTVLYGESAQGLGYDRQQDRSCSREEQAGRTGGPEGSKRDVFCRCHGGPAGKEELRCLLCCCCRIPSSSCCPSSALAPARPARRGRDLGACPVEDGSGAPGRCRRGRKRCRLGCCCRRRRRRRRCCRFVGLDRRRRRCHQVLLLKIFVPGPAHGDRPEPIFPSLEHALASQGCCRGGSGAFVSHDEEKETKDKSVERWNGTAKRKKQSVPTLLDLDSFERRKNENAFLPAHLALCPSLQKDKKRRSRRIGLQKRSERSDKETRL